MCIGPFLSRRRAVEGGTRVDEVVCRGQDSRRGLARGILSAAGGEERFVASKGRKRRRPRPWQAGAAPRPPDPGRARARDCRTKVAHDNRVAAEQAALEHEQDHGEAKSAYACRWCGRWHVGSPR